MDYAEIDELIPFDDIKLTDLIEVTTLQKVQDAFSRMARMAALTTDANGVAVTRGSNFSRLCTDFCRKSEIGRKRCEQCDINGAKMALKRGGPVSYYCHANLVDFAAPITVRGKVIGSFIGGQVLPEPPDLEKMEKIAEELGVDKDEFVLAAKETNIVAKSSIDRATEFLYSFTEVLSNIAYRAYTEKYLSEKANQAANAKADFLANMSHEIRTPMNAVLGMANIALRENLPPAARESIKQIVSSGKMLLTIINDILDYSKISAGKMEIIEEPYDPLSLVNDLASIVETKITDKDLEFLVDVNPNLPREILGDSIRIKQIITNLVNNAVKFTKEGFVCLHMDFERTGVYDDDESEIITLRCSVQDSGIGIKDEDKTKLFNSFQQVDTKRNRGVEGTGLGLAISKKLMELMGGEISVESEYGKGSTFSFSVPQTIKNDEPCFKIGEEKFRCGIIAGNAYVEQQLKNDLKKLGVESVEIDFLNCLKDIEEKQLTHLFIEQTFFSEKIQEFTANRKNFMAVVIAPFGTNTVYSMNNVRVVQKPIYVLNIAAALKNLSLDALLGEQHKEEFYFTAPEAEILIVDDNSVNLTVAQGLLEPLNMKIDFAQSGQECLEKISQKKYDIIFMDHMMPVMDGVETTVLIRSEHPDYKDVPIIALTANVMAETKNIFFQSGMNDFVPKPIELKVIVPKIRQWLPNEKIIQATEQEISDAEKKMNELESASSSIQISGLDIEYSLGLLGSEKLFWEVLKGWYKSLDKKLAVIQEYFSNEDWKTYTIEVHALKSSSRQVGALELSKLAAELEQAGNENNTALIKEKTEALLAMAAAYIPILKPYFDQPEDAGENKEEASKDFILARLQVLSEAFANLDSDNAEKIVDEMTSYKFSEKENEFFKSLQDAVDNMDMESGANIVAEWKDFYAN